MKEYNVLCTVSGAMGTRQALLKAADGSVRYFDNEQDAQAVAAELNKDMNGPYSSASFSYAAVEADYCEF
jgi:hypothetical protein